MANVIATVLLLYLTSLLAGAAAFFFLQRQARDKRPLLTLGLAYLLICIGALLAGIGEQRMLPHTLWTTLSLLIGFVGYALLLIGVRSIDHRRNRRHAIFVSLVALGIPAIASTSELWLDDRVRAATFHTLSALLTGAAAWNVWVRKRTEALPSRLPLAATLLASAATFAVVALLIVGSDDYRPAVAVGFAIQITTNYLISIFIFGIVKDRVEQDLELLSSCDALTGIGNRRWLTKRIPGRIMPGDALLVLDIDHFKKINDRYGHQTGDQVLVDFARKVGAVLRQADVFARIGGEEFVVFTSNISHDKAQEIGERIRAAVEKMSAAADGAELRVTTSIGVCWCAHAPDSVAAMQRVADQALYAAKSKGRNRVEMLVL